MRRVLLVIAAVLATAQAQASAPRKITAPLTLDTRFAIGDLLYGHKLLSIGGWDTTSGNVESYILTLPVAACNDVLNAYKLAGLPLNPSQPHVYTLTRPGDGRIVTAERDVEPVTYHNGRPKTHIVKYKLGPRTTMLSCSRDATYIIETQVDLFKQVPKSK